METLYPLSLRLTGRRVLVVGGGTLARQKLRGLAPTGAHVRVVAVRFDPALDDALAHSFAPERVERIQRAFRVRDLAGVALAFGATHDPAANRRVVAAARRRGILGNAVDDPDACDFHTPAVLRRHGLELAISTGGGFPGLTRAVREVLEAWLPEAHGSPLAGLYRLRRALLRSPLGPAERGRILRELAQRLKRDYLQPADASPPGATQDAADPEPTSAPPGSAPAAHAPGLTLEHS